MIHHFQPVKYFTTLGSHSPELTIKNGDTVKTTILDAAGVDGKGQQVTNGGNPMTGPFYVSGAEVGDTLAVELEDIRPNREYGFTRSLIASHVLEPGCQPPEYSRDKLKCLLDQESKTITLERSQDVAKSPKIPFCPMLGCLGTAPEAHQAISTATSGMHGGNMDYRGFISGTTAYFPVNTEGGLFFLGDGHAWQADGEILGTGVEVSMDVRFRMTVLKNKKIGWPRGENSESIFTLGNVRPLEQAVQHATTEMLNWLSEDYNIPLRLAHLLLGCYVKYEVGNIFDPAYTMVCKIDKKHLI